MSQQITPRSSALEASIKNVHSGKPSNCQVDVDVHMRFKLENPVHYSGSTLIAHKGIALEINHTQP